MNIPFFKVPNHVPQDILLIQDLVDVPPPPSSIRNVLPGATEENDDSIASSGSELDSEEEVEAGLVVPEDDQGHHTPTVLSDSSSDSESDSEPEPSLKMESPDEKPLRDNNITVDIDDDDESGPGATLAYVQTKNEVVDADILIPPVTTIGSDEMLEKVGEITSIVGNVVIVKGVASGLMTRASEKALDADTLLAFDDREVLGYIYETFGPTSQPLYQIKFNQKFPLDPEKVRVAREVFHVPQQSNFVFVNQLKKLKGSDASNINDEEPADHELEFSDDEQEAAHKSRNKRRSQSVASSRASTPAHSRKREEELTSVPFFGSNPYAEHGPYDMDFSVPGPSRPPPIPYDDPYAEEFKVEELKYEDDPSPETLRSMIRPVDQAPDRSHHETQTRPVRGRGRGRGRERGRAKHSNWESRTPRENPGRTWGGRGRDSHRRGSGSWNEGQGAPQDFMAQSYQPYDPYAPQSISPTSPVVDGATSSQFESSAGMAGADYQSMHVPSSAASPWAFPPEMYDQSYVQPHINPRFASAFGMNFNHTAPSWRGPPQQGQYNLGYQAAQPPQNWSDEWTVHGITSHEPHGSNDFPTSGASERPAPEEARQGTMPP
ncbi:hypothetical protein SERLA73DRAFT_78943 [Serpula lacrymans var. lacrymans S7.3]|uniref:H/ACA ribonucleoprotein complex non-core subunit NAF1 n=2 Tax=Serpula lacrymans var. lacrymans TaxID=341189 RepID=F8QET4_SERL3|nr:uncharacterized protein SERLADRAFT_412484 [Serpula lacrymans var. lacrymans S7.9]EGN93097.1 hypothetical protein SERLA73DRAFT_78943 [Serpula lacrymans var. lacrymans S7.3]EGO30992.1 hypothetical protein SERLADRAFT_412484 [Serpula lacrymans var. lacrymans S7.9]